MTRSLPFAGYLCQNRVTFRIFGAVALAAILIVFVVACSSVETSDVEARATYQQAVEGPDHAAILAQLEIAIRDASGFERIGLQFQSVHVLMAYRRSYLPAREMAEEILREIIAEYGPSSPHVTYANACFAQFLAVCGRYKESKLIFQSIGGDHLSSTGISTVRIVDIEVGRGNLLLRLGRFEEAFATAGIISGLMSELLANGYEAALAASDVVRDEFICIHLNAGLNHARTAIGLGRYEYARTVYDGALTKFIPYSAPAAASVYQLRAELLLAQGEAGLALSDTREAMNLTRGIFGENDSRMADLSLLMASSCRLLGDHSSAERWAASALESAIEYYGRDAEGLWRFFAERGLIAHERKNWEVALLCFERALGLARGVIEPSHPTLVQVVESLSILRSPECRE